MEKKTIKADDVFKMIDSEAIYLFKDICGKIFWSTTEPTVNGNNWTFLMYGESGCLGSIDIEEFQDLEWFVCLYKKGKGIQERNLAKEYTLLQERIGDLEQEIKKLKKENENLKFQLDLDKKFKNPYKDWGYPQQPYITYLNNKE